MVRISLKGGNRGEGNLRGVSYLFLRPVDEFFIYYSTYC